MTEAVAAMVGGYGENRGFALTSNHDVPLSLDPDGLAAVRYGLATQDYWDPAKVGYLRILYRTAE